MALDINVPRNPQRPGLFIDAAGLEAARERIATQPWAKAYWETLQKRADALLNADLSVPEVQAGHWHWYFCSECGALLTYDENKPHEHVCDGCGKVYTGDKYDAAWRVTRQNLVAIAGLNLALAYQLSGERKYAETAADVLRRFARVYPTFAAQQHGGRAFLQSLDESVWVIRLSWTYDLLADSGVFSEQDKETITNDLLRACAYQIKKHEVGGNWQTWHNSGMAAVGWCIGDEQLVRTAIENPQRGVLYQIENEFFEDGSQLECSIGGYHYYALRALSWTLEAAHYHGLNLWHIPKVKQAFLGPLRVLLPNGEFPALNDGSITSLRLHAPFYEIANARIDAPELACALRAIYEVLEHKDYSLALGQNKPELWKRETLEAVLYGKPLPESGGLTQESDFLPDLGLAALRAGDNYASLHFGPHGGGHGHHDKLGVILYGVDRVLAPDIGTWGYGIPLYHTWNKTTPAHNTVVIGGKSQQPAAGKLNAFVASPAVQFADASCDSAYPDTSLRRRIWLTPDYLIDFFEVSHADAGLAIDWLWHNWGKPVTSLDFEQLDGTLGETDGSQHLTNLRKLDTGGRWSIDWVQEDDSRLRLTMLGEENTQVILCDCPGTVPSQQLSAVVARRKARGTIYRSIAEPVCNESRILAIEDLLAEHASGVRVKMIDGSTASFLTAEDVGVSEDITLDKGSASACWDSEGELKWLQLSGGKRMNARQATVRFESEGSIWILAEKDCYRVSVVSGEGKLSVCVPGCGLEAIAREVAAGDEFELQRRQ